MAAIVVAAALIIQIDLQASSVVSRDIFVRYKDRNYVTCTMYHDH